ncbi:MAG: EAL domain-containing protein [Euzebyaceae bacterium]|jgi:EAL domain-containing protein (putative c-di-GMP-specific phosphodiesterase class I)|nr:EAL domain-containing protein [Euzebyaceae bacterium]
MGWEGAEGPGADIAAVLEATERRAAATRLCVLASEALGTEVTYLPVDSSPDPDSIDITLPGPDGEEMGVLRFTRQHDGDEYPPQLYKLVTKLLSEQLGWWERTQGAWRTRVERIRTVLASGRIPLAFQPIIDLTDESVVGLEVLARFSGPPLRGPDRWFAEANAVGLGVDLEMLSIRQALAALPDLPASLYLSVNVSPLVAASPLLTDVLAAAPLQRLVLEITEHERVADYDALNRQLAPLRKEGLRLAVDDAGSGFASFRHVLKLSPDIVKLDTSLVHEIDNDSLLRALGYTLTAFASALGAQVVAEGVETQREVDALRFLGVRFAQGYHLGRPVALGDVPVDLDSPVVSRTRPG